MRATEPIRPPVATPPPEPDSEPVASPAAQAEPDPGPEQDQGQGGPAEPKSRRSRRPRTRTLDAGGPQVGCKFYLPQQLHGRLWQFSLERGKTISELAAEILDRHVPRYKVERQG